MEVDFCVDALKAALSRNCCDIFNTDQGSQFTSKLWVETVLSSGASVSMDGRGRYLDNIFVERLWRSLKYEMVYLMELVTVTETRQEVGDYFNFYNNERPHQSLGYKTPREIYFL